MDLKLADLSKENSKYLRKDIDGGILTDKYEIDRYKLEQYIDVVDNLMLGNYNEFGEYIIPDDIKEELLNCRKVIEDNFENLLFVKSESEVNVFSNLHFVVRVTSADKEGYKKATLELLESIYKANGFIENTQATVIKKIVLENNDIFKDSVYKAFNIVPSSGNLGAKVEYNEESNFKNIVDRKVKLLYVKEKTEDNEEYKKAYNDVKEELSKTDEGKKIIESYKQDFDVAKRFLNVKDDNFKARTQLLLKNIERLMPKMPSPILNTFTNLNVHIATRINKVVQVNVVTQKIIIKKEVDVRLQPAKPAKKKVDKFMDILSR